MSDHVNGLGIRPAQWQFLRRPNAYRAAFESLPSRGRSLAPDSTARQFKTAREILKRLRSQKGVLLADDVGLGKTTVAALIATAFVARNKTVRVLAPNDVMKRRWRDEIERHLLGGAEVLPACDAARVRRAAARLAQLQRVRKGDVQVTTHGRMKRTAAQCDLLIVDEAHRSRSDGSEFGQLLDASGHLFGRVLLLTATPFSLSVRELDRALRLIGCDADTKAATRLFGTKLGRLWEGDFADARKFGEALGAAGADAVRQLRPWIIRHAAEEADLGSEIHRYSRWKPWRVEIPEADEHALGIVVRADRLLWLAKRTRAWTQHRTNDPRFHQGFDQLRLEVSRLPRGTEPEPGGTHQEAQEHHRAWLERALRGRVEHQKVAAAAQAITQVVADGEKVLVFCAHHATACELALALVEPRGESADRSFSVPEWKDAWRACLEKALKRQRGAPVDTEPELLETFVRWLSCGSITSAVSGWLTGKPRNASALERALENSPARRDRRAGTIVGAATELFSAMSAWESRSTRAKLAEGPHAMPGWGSRRIRVMSTVEGPENGGPRGVFFPSEPDTVMAIFNSPFGPDVLVTTDKLSEGVDLHRSCRHLMHYELNPSPIRTVQRRGRLRRIGSWAGRTRQALCEASPAFRGTRDEALVRIMGQRLAQFGLLLGGVGDIDVAEDGDDTDTRKRQAAALAVARRRLQGLSLAL